MSIRQQQLKQFMKLLSTTYPGHNLILAKVLRKESPMRLLMSTLRHKLRALFNFRRKTNLLSWNFEYNNWNSCLNSPAGTLHNKTLAHVLLSSLSVFMKKKGVTKDNFRSECCEGFVTLIIELKANVPGKKTQKAYKLIFELGLYRNPTSIDQD